MKTLNISLEKATTFVLGTSRIKPTISTVDVRTTPAGMMSTYVDDYQHLELCQFRNVVTFGYASYCTRSRGWRVSDSTVCSAEKRSSPILWMDLQCSIPSRHSGEHKRLSRPTSRRRHASEGIMMMDSDDHQSSCMWSCHIKKQPFELPTTGYS